MKFDKYITELNPITEVCSILVNIHGPLNLKDIEDSINFATFVYVTENLEHDREWNMEKKEYWLMKLSLKMEMILRNIMFNDKSAMKLTDSQLEGYLMGKAHVITGHFPPLIYVRSVIKVYKDFARASHDITV
jgi:hypothetical protein